MADRLHQELLAVPGLEQVTALQFQELPWKVSEQVLIALFQEHASSSAVAEELRVKSRDRRLERKTEKAENAERDVVRKNEERFKSEFMQIAATELSRLGAPAMITWQKLVFDRDCCAQAFRILLTKIKSSKRSNNSAAQSARPPIALAKRFVQPEDGTQEAENGISSQIAPEEQEEEPAEIYLPRASSGSKCIHKSQGVPSRRPSKPSLASSVEWNPDTSTAEPGNQGYNSRLEDDPSFKSPEISIQRTKIKSSMLGSTSAFATKLKKSQLDSLHQENASLRSENVALRNEVAHLEELVTTLQAESNQAVAGPQEFHHARMRFLQAQNMQLQRQISLLQEAVQAHEESESMLLTALSHWRGVVETGRDEARAAGAEERANTKDGKPAQWMIAVPEHLLEELNRAESQIDHAITSAGRAQEAKLRVGGTAAEFLRHSSSSIPFKDLYVPGVAHLRPERVKILETALASALRSLETMHDLFIDNVVPRMADRSRRGHREDGRGLSHELDEAMTVIRKAVLEVGAFGVVVPCATGVQRQVNGDQFVSVAQVLRTYATAAAPSSGVNVKDREKQLKVMLRQLQAGESAAEREISRLQKELAYWKNSWAMQEQLLRSVIHRVRSVGDKKFQWAEANLIHPLRDLHEVWTSFQRTQSQQDQRLHKNPYLPLLIDTIQRHEPVLCTEAVEQWQQHMLRYDQDVSDIIDDYNANCSLLRSYLGPSAVALEAST